MGEASVAVIISSKHRRDSIRAVEYAIDTIKARVPIWKKEQYADGTSNWKENCECGWKTKTGNPSRVPAGIADNSNGSLD